MNNLNLTKTPVSGESKKFLKNVVNTASPMQLIVLLYEGCMQWLHMAKQELKKNKAEKAPNWSNYSNYMGMAMEILTHLQDSLDYKQSRAFCEQMFSLYDFMKTNLAKANAKKEEKPIDDVVVLLKDLKDTWKEAMKKQA